MGLLDGKVAIVTGAARGIGRGEALQLAQHGAKVVVNDLGGEWDGTGKDDRPAQQVVDEIVAGGGEAVVNGDDVSSFDGAKNLVDQAIGHFGKLDVLICNAGILKRDSLSALGGDMLADLEAQFRVNAMGPLMTLRALHGHLHAGSKVAIITSRMGSMADNDSGGYYGYRMSKAAVNAAGRSLANDLRDEGVAVALIHPGWVRTDMGGANANVDAVDSARGIVARIEALDLSSTGSFWHADGQELPW